VRLSRLVTFAEVAQLLGEKGHGRAAEKRVRRRLLAHPSAEHFVLRHGRTYFVSLANLRVYIPQLRDAEVDTIALVRKELEEIDEKLTDMRDEIGAVAAECGRRVRAIEVTLAAMSAPRPRDG
jgi:HAMP domain-containing protein